MGEKKNDSTKSLSKDEKVLLCDSYFLRFWVSLYFTIFLIKS
jgi:hypothetical protein